MPKIKKDKERRGMEEVLKEQNKVIRLFGGGYQEIADAMEISYPEIKWRDFYQKVYHAFTRQILPLNQNGNADKKFARELITTTNNWLEEKESYMTNIIQYSRSVRGMGH